MKKDNPFYSHTIMVKKTAFIKSLGDEGTEITYRGLTEAENNDFNLRMIEGSSPENPIVNTEVASKIVVEKIALCLISPPVTAAQMHNMYDIETVKVELAKVMFSNAEIVDDEGNSKS